MSDFDRNQWIDRHGEKQFSIKDIEAILSDYDKTNRFMFTEDMSRLHANASAIAFNLLLALEALERNK